MKMTKNYKTTREKFDRMKLYPIDEAIALVQEMKFSKFDESIDLAINNDEVANSQGIRPNCSYKEFVNIGKTSSPIAN